MRRRLPPFAAVRAFESAARHASFKDAAGELHVTQSAISHQIRALEDFLGVVLFRRGPNRVELTQTGETYFRDVTSILDRLNESTGRITTTETDGPLRIRSTPAFAARWLLPRLAQFNAAYPDIELHIVTTIEPTDFAQDEVDLLIQYGQAPAPGLRTESFLSSSRFPVCAPGIVDVDRPIRTPEDLVRYTLLRDVVGDAWEEWFECAGSVLPDCITGPRLEHCDLTLRAAEQGQGVALGYGALIETELAGGALIKPFDIETPSKVIYSLTCPEAWSNRPTIAAFRNWIFDQVH